MRTLRRVLLVIAVVFVSSIGVSPSFGCTQPPILGKLFTWPPNLVIDVSVGNVPSSGFTAALNNWYNGLLTFGCGPILAAGSSPPYTDSFSYGSIPPPQNCPTGSTCVTRGLTTYVATYGGRLETVTTVINSQVTATAAITEVVAHELGHTVGLADCNYPSCPFYSSVMENGGSTTSVNNTIGQPGPTSCDLNAVLSAAPDYVCPPPPPPPECCRCSGPDPAKSGQTHNRFALRKVQAGGCDPGYSTDCCPSSPIIIDTSGNGFALTDAASGVKFDISGKGTPIQMAWTAANSGNAFLCLPDSNGACDDGKDLFGNIRLSRRLRRRTDLRRWPFTTNLLTAAMATASLTLAMLSSHPCVCGSTAITTALAS